MNLPRTLVLAALLLNTGCAAKSAVRGMDSRSMCRHSVSTTSRSWVWWSSRARSVHAVCPAGFEKVDVHQSFWNDFFRRSPSVSTTCEDRGDLSERRELHDRTEPPRLGRGPQAGEARG